MPKKIVVVALAVFFFGILNVPQAQAITLIPPSFEFEVAPGETIETKVKIFNEEQTEKSLYTETANFAASGETGNPAYDFSAPVEGISSWIEVGAGPFVLKPGDRLEIPVVINVPADAEPGGHYAVLAFSTNAPDTAGTQEIGIAASLGTLFLMRIEGEIVEEGAIKDFSLALPVECDETAFASSAECQPGGTRVFTRLPANFSIRYENTGNIHLRPTGAITISNLFNKLSGTVDVNPAKGATLPRTVRKYDAVWERAMVTEATGNTWDAFWQEFGNERANFAFGKYTARLALTAGSTDQIQNAAELTFWVLPWHLGVVYGIGLAVLIVLLCHGVKRYNAWIIRRSKSSEAESKNKEQNVTKGPNA